VTAGRTWYPLTGPVLPPRRRATDIRRAASPRAAASKPVPVDPLSGPKLALAGRVVTMDDEFTVEESGIVYVDGGLIAAVQPAAAPVPAGFESVPVHDTAGTLFPGLIELHNHLSFDALPPWSPVPKRFDNRGQWPDHKDYRKLISGPMTVIGTYRDAAGRAALVPALVRYVECKCLLGGVTTTQGVMLNSNAGIRRFYRGLVRNVEQTDEADLPEAQARIQDVDAKDARRFLSRLAKEDSCFLLHLSEGVTDAGEPRSPARLHFLALEVAPEQWALNPTFTGIHSTGLLPEDFDVLARNRSSIVWSPLSNLLLYGSTTRVEAAKASGVTIGLGSDWSPTGSKNLLGELKVAWLYDQCRLNGLFGARGIVAMATRDAAAILKWTQKAGQIVAGRRADLLVVDGTAGDPYELLLRASETDLRLVMVNGVARYGVGELMRALAPAEQTVRVGGRTRALFLAQQTGDPDVAQVSLATATETLRHALRDIARLAREAERPRRAVRRALDAPAAPVWTLALDEIRDHGIDLGPRLPYAGPRDFTGHPAVTRRLASAANAAPLSTILQPVRLDVLTVADDESFLDQLERQPNVPEPVRAGLRALY
jgi:5-methylthioadenosine/S-adenosylhomocysteine deaminase